MKAYIHKKTCTVVFLAALLMMAKPGLSHTSINGRIDKQTLLCPLTEIPLGRGEDTDTHVNTDGSQKHVE